MAQAKKQRDPIKITQFLIGIVIVLLIIVIFAIVPLGAFRTPVTSPVEGDGANTKFMTFSVNSADFGYTGNSFCINRGYSKCVSHLTWVLNYYYDSTDFTCQNLQYEDIQTESGLCDDILLDTSSQQCTNLPSDNEPEKGDFKWRIISKEVVCAR